MTLIARRWFFALIIATLAMSWLTPAPARAITQPDLNQAVLATVKLWPMKDNGELFSGCSGSIIQPTGFILTAWHCVGVSLRSRSDSSEQGKSPGDLYNKDGLVAIGLTKDAKVEPTRDYIAKVMSSEPKYDLAVVKIIRAFNNEALPAGFALPAMPIGDARAVQLKDVVHVLGYPGVGGPRITVTSGTISGFDDSARTGEIDALKLDASISGGHSGGATIDDFGKLIGVNSYGVSSGADKVDRAMMANLAMPLINQAVGGSTTAVVPTPGPSTSGPFGPIRFGSDWQNGKLASPGTTFTYGVMKVYAEWDFTGMRDGDTWGRIWKLNGQVVLDRRDADTWDKGDRGTIGWSYGDDAQPVDTGRWELALYVNGREVQRGNFTVESGQLTSGGFGKIRFGESVSNGRLVGEATTFPAGTKRVYAFWDYKGMRSGTTWGRIWYRDGKVELDRRSASSWEDNADGSTWYSYFNTDETPFDPGLYELELYLDGQAVQRASFRVGGSASATLAPFRTPQVALTGKVVDLDTGEPIAGAKVMVVRPNTTFDTWKATRVRDPLIITSAVTSPDGSFTTPYAVPRNGAYPLAIQAEGYGTTFFDKTLARVDANAPNTVDVGTYRIEED